MNPISYLRKNGIKHALKVVYQYKIDKVIIALLKPFLKNKPLQNIIIIESHNDFDCNGGAFYEYLIRNGYNKKYKIVLLLKHHELKPNDLPENVVCVPLFKPNIMKDYYICRAKIFTADNTVTDKVRDDQQSYYFTHGAGGLKNVHGYININNTVDYVLMQSENYAPIQAYQYSLHYPSKRLLFLGYPIHDVLNSESSLELSKLTSRKYNKVILWMPTFRKAIGNRIDSNKEQALGIPLINTQNELVKLNNILKHKDSLLIIKIHPMQDVKGLKIKTMSNILVLTNREVKGLNIDNYRLMANTDALISDYSGAAYDYLQLNKPIGYVLEDMNDYKLGFVIQDIKNLIAGHEIYNIMDLEKFIVDIIGGNDKFREKREMIKNYIYKYNDTNNCKRIVEFMGL